MGKQREMKEEVGRRRREWRRGRRGEWTAGRGRGGVLLYYVPSRAFPRLVDRPCPTWPLSSGFQIPSGLPRPFTPRHGVTSSFTSLRRPRHRQIPALSLSPSPCPISPPRHSRESILVRTRAPPWSKFTTTATATTAHAVLPRASSERASSRTRTTSRAPTRRTEAQPARGVSTAAEEWRPLSTARATITAICPNPSASSCLCAVVCRCAP